MEREINERELNLQRENIVVGGMPTDDYYTKAEVDSLLDEKEQEILEINDEQSTQNDNISQNTADIATNTGNIATINNNLINYSLIIETGSQIALSINSSTYVMTAILKDKNGNTIYTSNEIDLPLETMVVGASYDNTTKEIVLTLKNGATTRFSVADLVNGLVSTSSLATALSNYYTKAEVDSKISGEQVIYVGYGENSTDILSKLQVLYDNYKNNIATLLIWTPDIPESKNCILRVMTDYGTFIECKGQINRTSINTSDYGVNYKKAIEYTLKINIENDEVVSYVGTTNEYGFIPSSKSEILGIDNTIAYTPSGDYNPATKKYVDDNIQIVDDKIEPNPILGDVLDFNTTAKALNIDDLDIGGYIISDMNFSTGNNLGIYIKYTYNNQELTKKIGFSSFTTYYLVDGYYSLFVIEKSQSGNFKLCQLKALGYDPTNKRFAVATVYVRINNGSITPATSIENYNMVLDTGAQTISGVKTFNTLPESSITPTTNNQLVNKSYVDSAITSAIGSALNSSY